MQKIETEQKETRFKIVVYFNQKPDNSYYTYKEIEDLKHKKYLGSFDFRRGKQKQWITDEQDAYNKQVRQLEQKLHGRYKTAFIVINNYKGYTIVTRKYIDGILRFAMDIRFNEINSATGETKIYNIEAANNLIELHEKGLLNEAQKKLIKKVDSSILVALPYIKKQIKDKAA